MFYRIACAVAVATVVAGCDMLELDNYDAPESTIAGRVVYQGQPIGVANRTVQLELWEPGFELNQKIPVHVNFDGTFQARVFDGNYELNLLPGNGPWADDPTRIPLQVRGRVDIDVQVTPYFVVTNEQIVNNNGVIEATFNLNHVDTSRNLEYVGLYVGRTTIVDRINQETRREIPAAQLPATSGQLSLSLELPDDIHLAPGPDPRTHVFVRIGVKTVGRADLYYTQVHKVGI